MMLDATGCPNKSFPFFCYIISGDMSRPCESVDELLDVRLVDFAHAYSRDESEGDGPDENFLYGLKSFIKHLHHLK